MVVLIVSFWWDLLIIIGVLLWVIYVWLRHKYSYWKRKGIDGPKPSLLFGNLKDPGFRKNNLGIQIMDIYEDTKDKPYVGIYMLTDPTFMINDPEFIKRIMVKDFAHFTDHMGDLDFELDPLAGHLFNLGGERWKKMRAKLTPTFTSSRMKQMFNTMADCSEVMMDYLEDNHVEVIDVKETMAKFTTDVIGSCAFGVDCNSFKEPNSKFRVMGKRIFQARKVKILINLIIFFIPKLAHTFKLKFIDEDVNIFFYNLVNETIQYRENNNIVRNDFLQLLINMKKGIDDHENAHKDENDMRLSTMEMAAQVFVFFIAGFETSSTTASFALYELSLNPDIQEILVSEIKEVLGKHDGKITYDSLSEMTYLTMVIEETLRKYPPVPVLTRKCTKEYKIPDTDIVIEKNTSIFISNRGIQNDPKYFPNPKKFDPERFNQENKDERHHFTHIPFGEGPRLCIGNRFGLMQVKLGLVSFLKKYNVSVCNNTPIPMVFDKKAFITVPEGPIPLKLKKRSQI